MNLLSIFLAVELVASVSVNVVSTMAGVDITENGITVTTEDQEPTAFTILEEKQEDDVSTIIVVFQ